MKKVYVILCCGHTALLPKRWTECTCPTCGLVFINLR